MNFKLVEYVRLSCPDLVYIYPGTLGQHLDKEVGCLHSTCSDVGPVSVDCPSYYSLRRIPIFDLVLQLQPYKDISQALAAV